ncbi:MAG: hypothetical protein LBQ83_02285, partial [Candidatus Margulisbacteria bacterium]|nr:hypothetical protein [Candidatus Margulisiibacteriota bacterium]
MTLNTQELTQRMAVTGINPGNTTIEPSYMLLAAEMGLYAPGATDNSSLSTRFSSRGSVPARYRRSSER